MDDWSRSRGLTHRATFVPDTADVTRTGRMLYLAYQTQADIMTPVREMARAGLTALGPLANGHVKSLRNVTAAYELIARTGLTHVRPAYGIDSVRARYVHGAQAAPEAAPLAAGRRSLRCLQRQALGGAGLSAGAEFDLGE